MQLSNRCPILFTVLSVCMSLCAFGQIERLTDAQIPCDKVYAVQGNVAVGADYVLNRYEDLVLFDAKSGTIFETFEKRVQKAFSHGGIYWFLLSEPANNSPLELYLFENGQLLPAASDQVLNDLYFEPALQAVLGITAQGFVVFDHGELLTEVEMGARLLGLHTHGAGFLAVTENSYFILNTDFSQAGSFSIPGGLESFMGAALGEVLLLTTPAEPFAVRSLSLYNIATAELYPVVNTAGEADSLEYFVLPKGVYDGHFFVAGSGQITAQNAMTTPTDAGFINATTGAYTETNSRLGLRKGVVNPVVSESANGPLIFARMGIEGVEPYAISDQKIEIVKDIYEGFGGSVDLSVQNALNSNPLMRPAAFELAESGGLVYFSARSKHLGHQLWRTDGTEEGTFAITDDDVENKGFEKCFLSKDGKAVLLTILHRDGSRQLYKIAENPTPVYPDVDAERNWEVAYATHPIIQSGTSYIDMLHPGVYPAKDGSSALILRRAGAFSDHISFNHKWVLPANISQHFDANTAVQVLAADGSLKMSTLIRAREDQERTVGRAYTSGHFYLLVSHRPFDTFVDGNVLNEPREGHHLIELDENGRYVKSTFLPTGGKDHISFSQIKITEDAIYILGMAENSFTLNGAYENTVSPGKVRAVVMKYNLNHSLQWISDSGLDQDIFGSGLQQLEVGEDAVYIASGGTSYSVWSSCANSEWPYQISRFDALTGNFQWRTSLEANDVTRIPSMAVVGDQWLWIGGYTRGDLAIGDRRLDLVPNFMNCGYNGFLLCLNTASGTSSFFRHTDPSRAKFIQDIKFHGDHLYALSLVYEEDLFPVPIFGTDGRWNLQMDKVTNGGLKVDSLIWHTSVSRLHIDDRLRDHKFGFDFHPDGGVVLAAQEISNGIIDGFTSPSSEAVWRYMNSWLIQRRDIQELEDAALPPEVLPPGGREFEIYPNPLTGNSLVLKIPAEDLDKYDRIVLTDLQGRQCMQQNLSGPFESRLIEVDGALANGVYIVELKGSARSAAVKLVLKR